MARHHFSTTNSDIIKLSFVLPMPNYILVSYLYILTYVYSCCSFLWKCTSCSNWQGALTDFLIIKEKKNKIEIHLNRKLCCSVQSAITTWIVLFLSSSLCLCLSLSPSLSRSLASISCIIYLKSYLLHFANSKSFEQCNLGSCCAVFCYELLGPLLTRVLTDGSRVIAAEYLPYTPA